jgi:hypothetical protein
MAPTDPRLLAQRRQGLMLIGCAALGVVILKVREYTGDRTGSVSYCLGWCHPVVPLRWPSIHSVQIL